MFKAKVKLVLGKSLLPISYKLMKFYWFVFRPERVGAKVVVCCQEEILFVRHNYAGGNWTFPGGGVDRGEEPAEAAARELGEELGLKNIEVNFCGVVKNNREYKKDTINVFYTEVNSKEIKVDPIEISEAKWFNKNQLPQLTELNQAILSKANDRFK